MQELQLNILYTSLAEKESRLLKTLNAILNAFDRKGCWKVYFFFIPNRETRRDFSWIRQLNISCITNIKSKTIMKNVPTLVSQKIKPKQNLIKPGVCNITDKLRLVSPELYWSFALICSAAKPIWRQLNISILLRQEKSLSENAVLLYSSQQVVLHILKKTNTDKIYK